MTQGVRAARWAAWAAACAAACLGSGRRAAADDEPTKPSPSLEQRWISVGALTRPGASFLPDRGPIPATGDNVNDEVRPLFGGEYEEGVRAYGTVDQVIDLVRERAPAAREAEGASLAAWGTDRLVVRGSRELLDAASGVVADLERETLPFVTFDLLAVEGDGAAAAGEGGAAAALRSGALRVVGAVRTCGPAGRRVTALAGGERAYLIDHAVEVTDEVSTTDPIVGVLTEGLCVELFPAHVGPDLRVDVRAWVAGLQELAPRETSEGDLFEVPALRAREATAPMLRLVPGTWAYVAASRDFGFAVRATVRSFTSTPGGISPPSTSAAAVTRPLESTFLDVSDMANRSPSTRAPLLHLPPSNLTLPEPPELPDPHAFFPEEQLVDVLKTDVDPASWVPEGTALQLRGHRLLVRTDARHAAAVASYVAALRGAFVRSYRARATLVSLPLASFPELVGGVDDGATLLSDGGAALLARPGARVEERASVRLTDGGRTGVAQGTLHRYVGDYNVEIAKKAAIGDPRIFEALEGTTLDVAGAVTSDGGALALDLRMDRSTWRESRRVRTRHGEIECPSVGMDRVRGSLVVPLGATRLAGLWLEGDRVVLVLLTATAE